AKESLWRPPSGTSRAEACEEFAGFMSRLKAATHKDSVVARQILKPSVFSRSNLEAPPPHYGF
ncbi:MAG TPA: hypothetical protein VMD78_13915, partial [Candidatus Baltobacteraceae bacterium]|nr:hypothetical protein [Candidatus Baltobacteraceae bacterium]